MVRNVGEKGIGFPLDVQKTRFRKKLSVKNTESKTSKELVFGKIQKFDRGKPVDDLHLKVISSRSNC